MHDSSQNPIAGFLRKMNREIFFKVVRGQFEYETDMAQLQKYLDMAKQINSPEAAGNIYITVGMLQGSVGRFEDVLVTMDAAIQEFARATDVQHQQRGLGCWTNKGETYYFLGNFQQALATYRDVLAKAEQVSEEQDFFGDRYLLWSALGRCLMMVGDDDVAEQYFQRILDTPDKIQTQHIASIIDANIGLSEIHRQRAELRAAHSCAHLALDIALRQNDSRQMFLAHCALAHLAATQNEDPEPHYAAALDIIAPALKSAHNVMALLEEARYHQLHNNAAAANRFAGLAQQHFHAIDVHIFDEELAGLLAVP